MLNNWPLYRASVFSSEFTHLNLVIRLRKGKQLAFFQGFTCRCHCVETAGRCDWPHFFISRQVRSLGVVFLSFLVVGEVAICARNSGVDHLSRPEGCDLTAEGLEPYHENACVCGCIIF